MPTSKSTNHFQKSEQYLYESEPELHAQIHYYSKYCPDSSMEALSTVVKSDFGMADKPRLPSN